MKNALINKANRTLTKVVFKMKKHSPEILLVAGIVGGVTSAVMACKATLKINDVLDDTKETVEKIHTAKNDESLADRYTEKDANKDLAKVYFQTGVKLTKLYGPSIVLGALSVGSILTSNNIMRKRNVALAAAYTAIDTGFKKYRGEVVERFGKRVDYELKHGIKAMEIEETMVDEDGNETVVKKTVDVVSSEPSEYSKFFDEYSDYWEKDPEYNLMFLRSQQAAANDRLKAKGYLFLNEVYNMLGIPETKAGQVVGWIYDKKNPIGDGYVDFGIYDVYNTAKREFINGYNRSILLDFNVDGNILELM